MVYAEPQCDFRRTNINYNLENIFPSKGLFETNKSKLRVREYW